MATPIYDLGKDAIQAKGRLGAHKWLILRRFTQLAILAVFMMGPLAGFYILKGNLASSLVLETVPLTDPLLLLQMLAAGFFGLSSAAIIGAAIVAVFYFIVGGRAYCSWVCPVNIVTDAAHWSRRKLGLKTKAGFKPGTRYWILALTLILSAVTGTLAYEIINPVSIIYRGFIFGMGLGWVFLIGIFLFDLLVSKHGWCGHLCPMGAFYGLIGSASLVRIRADARDRCDDCMECYEVCPEPQVLPPALKSADKNGSPVILSGACTNCGNCIDICPHNVFAIGLRTREIVTTKDPSAAEQSPPVQTDSALNADNRKKKVSINL